MSHRPGGATCCLTHGPRSRSAIGSGRHGRSWSQARSGQLWPLVCEHNPRLEPVQRKAGRELPLIRLVDLVEAR
jgi:hypothetical protein